MPGLHAFCWLLCVAFLLKFLSTLPVFAGTESKFTIEKPDSTLAWFFCILNFAAAAFYEEVIYRFYLTDALLSMISKKSSAKVWMWICEIFTGLCFAAAHLYLGIFSAVNAALAHVILRGCYKKSEIIWFCVFAHFFYNVISLILL